MQPCLTLLAEASDPAVRPLPGDPLGLGGMGDSPALDTHTHARPATAGHESSSGHYGGTRGPPDGRRLRHHPPHPEVLLTSTTRSECHQRPG